MTVAEFQKEFLPLQNLLYTVAFRILRNTDDARDTVQDVYVKLWQMRDDIDTSSVNIKAYTAIMMRNACYDRLRRHRIELDPSPLDVHFTLSADTDVGGELENRELVEIAGKIIKSLPAKQREVVELRHLGGMELKDIADAVGENEGNVRVLLSRARRLIKERLEKIIKYEGKHK